MSLSNTLITCSGCQITVEVEMVALNCIRSAGFVSKVARYIVQGPVALNKMGNPFSRSYSPQRQNQQQQERSISRTSFASTSRHETQNMSSKESTDNSNIVEAVVCKEDDLKDNEMRVVDVGNGATVLLIKQKGEFRAIGTKCTHYGAPLVNGALGDGRVRCPWHGACFNTKTGDIEDFPGFDALPCYQVSISTTGDVKVRAKKSDLETNKRSLDMRCAPLNIEESTVVIIGGGPSGATCAETLRQKGFKGRVIIVAKEKHLPYDRIKVSKIGTVTEIEKITIRSPTYYINTNIEIRTNTEATKVNTVERFVHLNNGKSLRYDHLYIATGSKPRIPDVPGIDLKNIFTVREFEDSKNILQTLGSNKDKNVVVLGLSFIGLEIAASCNEKAKSMTVVGKDTQPLGQVFGEEIGGSLRKLFEDKGVKFHFNTTINKCNGENGVIKSVELENGTELPADILILGVGTTYNTDFLKDSDIELEPNGAVSVDSKLKTNIDNVYAGGDIAKAPVAICGNKTLNIGHIGLAQYHGRVAAMNILDEEAPLKTVPYFWTMLFGKSIRYAGHGRPASTLIDGDVNDLKFVIFFFDESDKVIAIASCMRDPVVSQFAEFLHQGRTLYKKDLQDDFYGWINQLNTK